MSSKSQPSTHNEETAVREGASLCRVIKDIFYLKFYGSRLIYRLAFYFFFGLALHLYVLISPSNLGMPYTYQGVLLGMVGGALCGLIECKRIKMRIIGNIYIEPHSTIIMRVLILCIYLFIICLLNIMKIPDKVFYPYLAIPLTLMFPIAVLVAMIWLLRYEKINGPVYIKKEGSINKA